ncbi:MAG: YIP1 family protein [Planctomycetota bacterium]
MHEDLTAGDMGSTEPRDEGPVASAPVWALPLIATIRPVAVVQRHVSRRWDSAAWVVFMIAGIGNAADNAVDKSLGDRIDPAFLALLIFGLGAAGGALSGLVMSGILRLASRVLGGRASMADLRGAMAWGMMPSLIASASTWPVLLGMLGFSYFRSDLELSPLQGGFFVLAGLLLITASIWSLVNTSRAVGFVNGYGGWKGFLTLAIPGIVVFALIMLVALVVFLAASP